MHKALIIAAALAAWPALAEEIDAKQAAKDFGLLSLYDSLCEPDDRKALEAIGVEMVRKTKDMDRREAERLGVEGMDRLTRAYSNGRMVDAPPPNYVQHTACIEFRPEIERIKSQWMR
jgi:hypothetical protein